MHSERSERFAIIKQIETLKIRKLDIANLATVRPERVSDYIHHRDVPMDRASRIEKAVLDVVKVWTALAPYRIDTSDTEVFRRAIEEVNNGTLALASKERVSESCEVEV